jgi:parallel beta-helix repeat protein
MSVGRLRRGWRRGGVGLCALAAAGAVALLAAPAQGALHCGDTITKSKKLKANLVDCPGTALTIDGDGIDLDLNHHTIKGAGEDGIHVVAGSSKVAIHGGEIRFAADHGVLVDETSKLRLANLSVDRGENRGIQVNDSSSVRMTKVSVSEQGDSGVYLSGVEGARLETVGVEDAMSAGLDLTGVDGLTVEGSYLHGNGETGTGMAVSGVVNATFENILIEQWGNDGVRYFPGAGTVDNEFTDVRSIENGDAGFHIGNGETTKLRGVVAKGNANEGVYVDAEAADVKVNYGRFNGNANGLFFADGSSGSVRDNVANNNDEIGIRLPPSGVLVLGGNSASGNGVQDCVNLTCP